MASYLHIHSGDAVAVALQDLPAGFQVSANGYDFALLEPIPAGHKFALVAIASGQSVIKYGYSIGVASCAIQQGAHVHSHNLHSGLTARDDYQYQPQGEELSNTVSLPGNLPSTFDGYLRKNGEAGVRNEIWVIPTVGCVNGTADAIVRTFLARNPAHGTDAVWSLKHPYGCSQLAEDHENTRYILKNMVLHPNAGGVLVLGLGCENNQIGAFRELLGDYDSERVIFLESQKLKNEVEEGVAALEQLARVASADKRVSLPLSALRVGLKCGGSDGFSGITANPLLGRFSDWLISAGGTTVLTEVPEMFGAETLLMNRCTGVDLFEKTVGLINSTKQAFVSQGLEVYENPSPGNRAGGITTLEEKSLGCVQKGGHALVKGVMSIHDRLGKQGLHLLEGPGNDMVAITLLAASGCQIILFTTGRGTPLGGAVPTVKVSTNSALADNKPHWIDFNAGSLLEGEEMPQLTSRFIEKVLSIAGGEPTRAEEGGYREIAIYKTGVTL